MATASTATHLEKSHSLEQFERLEEELMKESEAATASDGEAEVMLSSRESGIFELTQSQDKDKAQVKREEEIEAEFFDLLNTLVLELNEVKTDVRFPPGEKYTWGQLDLPHVRHVPELGPDESPQDEEITTCQTRHTSDAATQTDTRTKQKSWKCRIL